MLRVDIDTLFSTETGKSIYDSITRTISDFSMRERLVSGVLVGFSGGADSVMLLCALKKHLSESGNTKLLAVHINHMIRGAEALRDEEFSREFCASLGIEFLSRSIDVLALSRELSKGLEETARNARYSEFNNIISGRNDISCIAVAHNATDNLETMIFNLMRGTGTKGLAGISPIRDNVLRPLILIPKRDIVAALDSVGVPYVYDSTNAEIDYTRNYIRLEVLPKLTAISSNPEAQAARAAANLRLDASFIDDEADKVINGFSEEKHVGAAVLAKLHPAVFYRVLSAMARTWGDIMLEKNHVMKIRELLEKGSDFSFSIPGGVSFICHRGECFIGNDVHSDFSISHMPLSMGINHVDGIDAEILLSNEPIEVSYSKVYKISIQQAIDFDIIKGVLSVRSRRDGDAYVYGNMTHKLKKMFIDKKIPVEKRGEIPIICDENGILWVPGFSVRDGGSKNAAKKLYIAIAYKA